MSLKNHPVLARFNEAGAQCIGGNVILAQQVVAHLRDEAVILTPEGEIAIKALNAKAHARAAVQEVEVKAVTPAAAKPGKGKAAKAAGLTPPTDPVPPADAGTEGAPGHSTDGAVDLDALLVAQGLATPMS